MEPMSNNMKIIREGKELTNFILKPSKGWLSNVYDPIEATLNRSRYRIAGIATGIFSSFCGSTAGVDFFVNVAEMATNAQKLSKIDAKLVYLNSLKVDENSHEDNDLATLSLEFQKQIYGNLKQYTKTAQDIKKWCLGFELAGVAISKFPSEEVDLRQKLGFGIFCATVCSLSTTGYMLYHWYLEGSRTYESNKALANRINNLNYESQLQY